MGMESFKVGKRQKIGNLVGKDPYGNSYYELPAQPQLGKRRPSRWYNTADITKDDAETGPSEKWGGFDAELPSEWESWLRHRSDHCTDLLNFTVRERFISKQTIFSDL